MSVAADDTLSGTCTPEELSGIFPFLDREEGGIICSLAEVRRCPAGSILMKDGDDGDYLGFLLAGRLAVKKETAFPGKLVLVAILERGSLLGEMSMVERDKRHATVVAMEDCRLLVLTCDQMTRLLAEFPALGSKLLKRIIHVLGYRLRMASDRLSKLL